MWRGNYVETNYPYNEFNYCEVQNAGSNYVYCCNDIAAVYLRSGMMTIENSVFPDNGGCAIYVRERATLTESGNSYSNKDLELCP